MPSIRRELPLALRTPRARSALPIVAALAAALLAYLLVSHEGVNALAAMTQKTADSRFNFGGIGTYLKNVRDALIPLAVPIAGLSAVLVAFLLFTGNPRAQQIGGSIAIALGLAFFSPNIIA